MPAPHQVIHIHPDAPPKPALGAPCNGCGVCCLAEPCPVGMLVSGKRRGACDALVWLDASDTRRARYHCGLMLRAADAHGRMRPLWQRLWQRLWLAWVRRLISAGSGCDASLVPVIGAAQDTPIDTPTDPPVGAPPK